MKAPNHYSLILLLVLLIAVSCQKAGPTSSSLVKTKELTNCPPNSICDYYLSDLDRQGYQRCDYAVLDTITRCKQSAVISTSTYAPLGLHSLLSIKFSGKDTAFTLNTADIGRGFIQFSQAGLYCNPGRLKPVYAIVEGTKSRYSRGRSRWLIDAEVVLAEVGANKIVDTLRVRQYFE